MKVFSYIYRNIHIATFIFFLLMSTVAIQMCGSRQTKISVPPIISSKTGQSGTIGTSSCLECHEEIGERMEESKAVHTDIIKGPEAEHYCESCHGPGEKHADSNEPEDIFNTEDMKKLSSADKSQTCLVCHKEMADRWFGSIHNQISCWLCHGNAIHGNPAEFAIQQSPAQPGAGAKTYKFCFQCHNDIQAEFLLQYHHPITRTDVDCTSCHSIHGETQSIENEAEAGSTCINCHNEIAGPWVFEHEALKDGCSVCHQPHGSVNRKLIKADNNILCLQCHFQMEFPTLSGMNHQYFIGQEATCWQCHFEVHGSNTSPSFSPGR